MFAAWRVFQVDLGQHLDGTGPSGPSDWLGTDTYEIREPPLLSPQRPLMAQPVADFRRAAGLFVTQGRRVEEQKAELLRAQARLREDAARNAVVVYGQPSSEVVGAPSQAQLTVARYQQYERDVAQTVALVKDSGRRLHIVYAQANVEALRTELVVNAVDRRLALLIDYFVDDVLVILADEINLMQMELAFNAVAERLDRLSLRKRYKDRYDELVLRADDEVRVFADQLRTELAGSDLNLLLRRMDTNLQQISDLAGPNAFGDASRRPQFVASLKSELERHYRLDSYRARLQTETPANKAQIFEHLMTLFERTDAAVNQQRLTRTAVLTAAAAVNDAVPLNNIDTLGPLAIQDADAVPPMSELEYDRRLSAAAIQSPTPRRRVARAAVLANEDAVQAADDEPVRSPGSPLPPNPFAP